MEECLKYTIVCVIFNFVELPKVSENKQLLIFLRIYFPDCVGMGIPEKPRQICFGCTIYDCLSLVIRKNATHKGTENACKRKILEFLKLNFLITVIYLEH